MADRNEATDAEPLIVKQVEQVEAPKELQPQLVEAVDGYGSPILFASVFVYIAMLMLVKPRLEQWAADNGKDEAQRSRLTMSATLIPGLAAACLVDFTPIASAFGVNLHWAASLPAGAVFYAGGGVLVHNAVKRFDPLGKVEEKIFGRSKEEIDAEIEERYVASTTRAHKAITQEDQDRYLEEQRKARK